ncbi:MAG: hypothetical protein H5T73_01160 [Actinobacteria bacterium]|nr:hypothetical protein [Actinomycetota bacterium]
MKRSLLLLVLAFLLAAALGCGGRSEGETGQVDALALLMRSSEAMSALSGYRMSGTMEIGMGGTEAGGGSLRMQVAGEVDNTGEIPAQHITVEMGTMTSEAYIVGGYYYQDVPGQGWIKMDVAQYRTQNMGMGMVDPQQWKSIAEAAEDITVEEEAGGVAVISLKLGEDFFRLSFQQYQESLSDEERERMREWLDLMQGGMEGFSAEIRMWIGEEDHLVRRMQIDYRMENPQVGSLTGTMNVELSDYGAEIRVTLPEGAGNASEFSPSSMN